MTECSARGAQGCCFIRRRCRARGRTARSAARRGGSSIGSRRAGSAFGRRCRSGLSTRMARRIASARPMRAFRVCSTPSISSSLRELPRGVDFGAAGSGARRRVSLVRERRKTRSIGEPSRGFVRRERRRLFVVWAVRALQRALRRRAVVGLAGAVSRSEPSAICSSSLAEDKSAFRAIVFEQYLFDLEWSALKRYANDRGVHLFGDLPFYVDQNSVDVWRHRELFALDANGRPREVAGVPPDYFNEDGQLWGNPLYDWDAMQRHGFGWWLARIEAQLAALRPRADRSFPRARVVLGRAGRREDGARRRVARGARRRAPDRAAREARRVAARRRGPRHHHGRRPRVARPVRAARHGRRAVRVRRQARQSALACERRAAGRSHTRARTTTTRPSAGTRA